MKLNCIKNVLQKNKKLSALALVLTLGFGTPTAYAQKFIREEGSSSSSATPKGDKQSITNQISNIASINGLLVGYGFYCNINPDSVKVLHTKYFETVARITDEEYKKLATDEYEAKVKIAREKGPEFSQTNCEFVVGEYKKIMNLINKNADKLFENNDAVIRKKSP